MVHDAALRLDKWLFHARISKSRAQAQKLCEARRLRLDGRVIEKGSALVRPGAVVAFPQGERVRVLRVLALGERRGPYPEACALYTELATA